MLFCKHKWSLVVDETLPSPMSELGKLGYVKKFKGGDCTLLKKTHIVVMSCDKCGKVFKSVERG